MAAFETQILIVSLAWAFMISLVTTFLAMPWIMNNMRKRGIVGKDRNKLDEPIIPEMGGVGVVLGYFAGLFTFIITYRFLFGEDIPNAAILMAGMFTILGCAFVGAIDDLFDLRQRVKAILPAFFAIPLAYFVVSSGGTTINLFNLAVFSTPPILMALIILFSRYFSPSGIPSRGWAVFRRGNIA